MVSRVCQRYGYDEGDVYNWLKGLSTDLNIFKDEQSLKKYLDTVADLCNRRNPNGEVIYYKPVWNYRDNHPMVVPDMDLIREIAILKSSHEHSVQIDRLCFMVEQRKMSAFELKNTLNYFKEGYISASTIDIALSNGFNGNVTSLISPVAPDKTMKRTRKQLLKELSKSSPELKAAIKQLEKEMGNDIYRVQWERLNGINITDADRLAFIKDVKNIQFMKDTENYAINYFIKLPGYGQDGNWARAMVNITEYASGMMRRGASFDEVMSYIAKDSRSYTLESMYKSGKEIDNDKARSYGILRCEKDGYLVDGTYANYGAITPFNNGGNYDAYTSRFTLRFAPNELRNPFPGEIELTRLAPNEKYPIKPERYNPNNPKHVKIVDGNGVTRYYEITDAMIHPDGKYAGRALEMVEARHDKLLKQFQGKKITAADMDIINESIGEIHWILAHSMPWGRGSDAIANSYVKALYQSLGIRTSEPAPKISFDLQAFCTELEDYKKIYKDLYAVPPEPKN